MKCLQCGSERLVKNVRAVDYDDGIIRDLKLEAYDNPDAWIFKGTREGKLKANVCAECGFVMFFVSQSAAQILEQTQKKI